MKTGKLKFSLLLIIAFAISACTTIETHLPQGPQGEKGLSAFDFWVESVKNGTVEWDKNATTAADFFKYLKGKDGASGLSSYDQWKEYIAAGNVEDPHNKGQVWSSKRNTMQDFWYFLTGATGERGLPGKDGKDGVDGRDGRDGTDGRDGRDGTDGRDGRDGTDGTNGTNGTDGTDGTNGLSAYELWKKTAETGNLDNPHKKGEKWDKTKVSESDFWEYLRGADATGNNNTEKEATALTITKDEEVDGNNWLVEVKTTPGATVTFSNGTNERTETANDQGVVSVTFPRDERRDSYRLINATAEGKTPSKASLVNIPRAKLFFTPKYTEATNVHKDLDREELEFVNHINDNFLVDGNPYADAGEKVPLTTTAYNNEKLVILNYNGESTLTIPVDFKGAEEVILDNKKLEGNITFDKVNKKLIIQNINYLVHSDIEYYANGSGTYRRVTNTVKENSDNAEMRKYNVTPISFRVRYSDGTISDTESIKLSIWSLQVYGRLPEE